MRHDEIMSRYTINVAVRRKDKELIEKVSEARGEQLSDFVRRAIRKELAALGYLNENQKKALGIQKSA
jgi:uncharacterized protein (DUF1778 family)